MGSLRILVVDDHAAILLGVRSLLASRRDWLVRGEAREMASKRLKRSRACDPTWCSWTYPCPEWRASRVGIFIWDLNIASDAGEG